MNPEKEKYVAFLRGINVGGHHKVPMAELRKDMESLGYENIITLLNSGNVIFEAKDNSLVNLENALSKKLKDTYGFPVPVLVRRSIAINTLFQDNPFQDVEMTKNIRLYVSFMRKSPPSDLDIPWTSPDNSFKILEIRENAIISYLDISISKTPAAMQALDKFYGSDITTRNWNTIERVVKII